MLLNSGRKRTLLNSGRKTYTAEFRQKTYTAEFRHKDVLSLITIKSYALLNSVSKK